MKKRKFMILSLVGFMFGYIFYKYKTSKNIVKAFETELEKPVKEKKIDENDFRKYNDYNFSKRKYIKVPSMGENF